MCRSIDSASSAQMWQLKVHAVIISNAWNEVKSIPSTSPSHRRRGHQFSFTRISIGLRARGRISRGPTTTQRVIRHLCQPDTASRHPAGSQKWSSKWSRTTCRWRFACSTWPTPTRSTVSPCSRYRRERLRTRLPAPRRWPPSWAPFCDCWERRRG